MLQDFVHLVLLGGSWGSSGNGMGMERPDSSITLPPSRVKRTGPTMLVVLLPRSTSALATPVSSVSLPKSGLKNPNDYNENQ